MIRAKLKKGYQVTGAYSRLTPEKKAKVDFLIERERAKRSGEGKLGGKDCGLADRDQPLETCPPSDPASALVGVDSIGYSTVSPPAPGVKPGRKRKQPTPA